MPFLKESPRTLAIFFVLSGFLGLLISIGELGQLSTLARQTGGLSGAGQAYQFIVYIFIGIALLLLLSGIVFKKIACSVPILVPSIIIVAILLKIVAIALIPQTIVSDLISSLVLIYLLFQYRRVSRELLDMANQGVQQDAAAPRR